MLELIKERKIEAAAGAIMGLLIIGAFVFPDFIKSIIGVSKNEEWSFNVPKYSGRPTEEYREVPEEVKLFNEAQMNELKRRLADYASQVKANPDQFEAWLQLGAIKKVIGDYEGARDAWEYLSIIRPQNFPSFKNLGELYWHYLPDYQKAEYNFRTAIKNDPSIYDAYVSLSDMYRYSYTEKAGEAEKVLLEGLEKNPKLARDFTAYIARFYQDTGEIRKAIEWYEKLKPLDSKNTAEINAELVKLRAKL